MTTHHRWFSSVWRGFQQCDRNVVRWGPVRSGCYLRPDQFLDHLTVIIINYHYYWHWQRHVSNIIHTQVLISKHKHIHLVSPDMLGDESMAGWKHVLLRSIEEEDDVVLEGLLRLRKHLQDLEHDRTRDCIVACPWKFKFFFTTCLRLFIFLYYFCPAGN